MPLDTYKYRIEEGSAGAPLLFTFHGTGGDEHQFPDLARDLLPAATIVSPRGDVSEGGALRFFRRTGEGVYDMDDLAARTEATAAFVEAHIAERKPSVVLGLGYSNGANILASVLFARPALFDGAVLMHPLIPFQPEVDGSLEKTAILITAGRKDPICPPNLTNRLESYLDGLGAKVETVWHEGAHEVRPVEIDAARRFLSRWS
ncbi:alpha/beta hydrolase [Aliihoeflea sp. PC F10.4]